MTVPEGGKCCFGWHEVAAALVAMAILPAEAVVVISKLMSGEFMEEIELILEGLIDLNQLMQIMDIINCVMQLLETIESFQEAFNDLQDLISDIQAVYDALVTLIGDIAEQITVWVEMFEDLLALFETLADQLSGIETVLDALKDFALSKILAQLDLLNTFDDLSDLLGFLNFFEEAKQRVQDRLQAEIDSGTIVVADLLLGTDINTIVDDIVDQVVDNTGDFLEEKWDEADIEFKKPSTWDELDDVVSFGELWDFIVEDTEKVTEAKIDELELLLEGSEEALTEDWDDIKTIIKEELGDAVGEVLGAWDNFQAKLKELKELWQTIQETDLDEIDYQQILDDVANEALELPEVTEFMDGLKETFEELDTLLTEFFAEFDQDNLSELLGELGDELDTIDEQIDEIQQNIQDLLSVITEELPAKVEETIECFEEAAESAEGGDGSGGAYSE